MQLSGGSRRWRGDFHDRYGSGVFADGNHLNAVGGCGICGIRNWIPLKGDQHFHRREEHSKMKTKERSRRGLSIESGVM